MGGSEAYTYDGQIISLPNATCDGRARTTHTQGGVGGDKRDLSMLVSSVEIVGADGQVQVVFFPVPEWIKTYWQYPLVQKAKVRRCSLKTMTVRSKQ